MPYIRCELLWFRGLSATETFTKSYRFGVEFAPKVVQVDGNVGHLGSLSMPRNNAY